MIEVYLSTDGKHTVKVSSHDRDEAQKLFPYARDLYEAILERYGTKEKMWRNAMNGNGKAAANGQANGQNGNGDAPNCPVHDIPMKYIEGKNGPFWSCPKKLDDGSWCKQTKDASAS